VFAQRSRSLHAAGVPAAPADLAAPLLAWYDAGHRPLPWRGIDDLYRIWVSEVMLQQTRVDTVLGYYDHFLERFPTVQALAAADLDDVVAAWSGLGFYGRARRLHAGAVLVAEQHDGRVPEDPAALGALPGIGRYTVGAILSSGRNAKLPILDGNVIRVLARVFRVDGAIDRAATLRRLWELAEAVLPDGRPGDFNQALMDLGATVCVPLGPRCAGCPLTDPCEARAAGVADDLPVPGKRAKVTFERRVAVLLRRADGRFLLRRRPTTGLLPGMWELPSATVSNGVDPGAEAAAMAGVSVRSAGTVEHRFSHRHWTIEVFAGRAPRVERAAERDPDRRWVLRGELGELPLPTVSRRTIDVGLSAPA